MNDRQVNTRGTEAGSKSPRVGRKSKLGGLLDRCEENDDRQSRRLVEKSYGELKRISQKLLRHEYGYNTLQTQALVHEAYLKFIKLREIDWQNPQHYFSVWKGIMRRVLIDHARADKCEKRGGQAEISPLTDCIAARQELDKHDLYDALEKLKQADDSLYQVIDLSYFNGMTVDEIAVQTGKSTATVKRKLHAARDWLFQALCH